MTKKTVFIASDHRGVPLKRQLIALLKEKGYEPRDFGPDTDEHRVNATEYAVRLASAMRENKDALGILICGTGQAMAMTANRFRHIFAALCSNTTMARMAREHNGANVLVLGADITGIEVAQDCLETFLSTEVLGGRYADRRQMLCDLGGL